MFYLVNCSVNESHYEGEESTFERNHIVEAESENEAGGKIHHYYYMKDVPYLISYYVNINYSTELIT